MSITEDKIRNQIASNPVLLYMKGVPDAPFIRERLPKVSNWPTFPQLFINGELIGGSDVICDIVSDGSLTEDSISTTKPISTTSSISTTISISTTG